ncbi:MAG: sigma-54 dependent transcriptional regulator [Pirellulales bacterium]
MPLRILIADDEQPARYGMKRALECEQYEIDEAADGQAALDAIRAGSFDLVYLDLAMPALSGKEVLRTLRDERIDGRVEVIVVTADDTIQTAVQCVQLGAADYINKPYEVEQIRAIARRSFRRVQLQQRVARLQQELDQRQAFGALVGVSRPMRDLFSQMERAARAPVDVLVQGETGTGKELIARQLHHLSERADGPFVAVNTAAMTETLIESELFGHVRGAFTGAQADRVGYFQQAAAGTLFLDEIGDMPLPAQAKILRALQERVICAVGSSEEIEIDVRVISATNQKLPEAIEQGLFRQDLYYRIKGVQLTVPPLRDRHEDIIVLANFFLEREATRGGGAVVELARAAIDAMLAHPWPGNVRELEHLMVSAIAMKEGDAIGVSDLGLESSSASDTPLINHETLLGLPLTEARSQLVAAFERQAIEAALRSNDNNVSAAARQLGIHRQSLQQKMAQLNIQRP